MLRFTIPALLFALSPTAKTAMAGMPKGNSANGKKAPTSGKKGTLPPVPVFDSLIGFLLDNECPPWNESLESLCTANDGTLVSPTSLFTDSLTFCCKNEVIGIIDLTDCREPPAGGDCSDIVIPGSLHWYWRRCKVLQPRTVYYLRHARCGDRHSQSFSSWRGSRKGR